MAWSTRRTRQQHGGTGHVDRSRASRRTKARGLGQGRPRTAGFGEALHDLFPVPGGGVPENDPTVEIDPFERTCRAALCPPRIGQVLLRRFRDGARPQEEGEPTRLDDDRFQCRRSWPRGSSTGYSTTGSARRSRCLRDCEPECLHRFHTVTQFEFVTDLPMGQTRLTGVQVCDLRGPSHRMMRP
jgi:hypothetical protein